MSGTCPFLTSREGLSELLRAILSFKQKVAFVFDICMGAMINLVGKIVGECNLFYVE